MLHGQASVTNFEVIPHGAAGQVLRLVVAGEVHVDFIVPHDVIERLGREIFSTLLARGREMEIQVLRGTL